MNTMYMLTVNFMKWKSNAGACWREKEIRQKPVAIFKDKEISMFLEVHFKTTAT